MRIAFFIVSCLMALFIALNSHKISSDIYDLLDLNHKQIASEMKEKLSSEIIILSKEASEVKRLEANNLFEKIALNTQIDLLANLDYKIYLNITQKKLDFFNNHAIGLLGFGFNLANNDFFNLANYSSLLKQRVKFDVGENLLFVEFGDEKFYFSRVKLRSNASKSEFLKFIESQESNPNIFISGASIFSSLGAKQGISEGIFMGGLSFILIAALLLASFKNLAIFKLIFVVIFSFLCGIFGAFVFLEHISLLSLVISTSLIGLILDFAMHFLCKVSSVKIAPDSIKPLLKIFLIGLFVTSVGYGIFLFSPMIFLKQIAVISICALIGAFLATYFLLPRLLLNQQFYCIDSISNAIRAACKLDIKLGWILFLAFILIIIASFREVKFSDNIKEFQPARKISK